MGVAVFGDLPAASRKANVYEFDRAMQRKRFPKTLFGKSWGYFICLWFPVHAFFLFGRRRDRHGGRTPLLTVSLVDIGRKSAVIEGIIAENQRLEMSECGIYWSADNPQPTASDNKVVVDPDSLGAFRLELDNLKGGTTYYVKGFVSMPDGVLESDVQTFCTLTGAPSWMYSFP